MARIKELQEKLAKDGLSKAEKIELKSLIAEAKDVEGEDASEESADDAVEEEVEALASKLEAAATAKTQALEDKFDKVLDAISKGQKEVKATSSPKFMADASLGSKSVEELSEIKVAVPGREKKQTKEVSAVTTHFIKALAMGQKEKLQLLLEGTGAQGGFLVPEEFANMIVEDRRDMTVMRQLADVLTTSSDTLHLPGLNSRPKAAWRSEAAVKNTSTVTFSENVFTPYSQAVIVGMSREFQEDATLGVSGSVVNYVSQLMARAIAENEDDAFFVGTGTGQPTGVTTYPIDNIASGVTDAERADTIQRTYRRLPQGYRNSASWVANTRTWEVIDTLKDLDGNYLLRGLADSPTPVLKGRPIFEQNDIADGLLLFGDFSFYKIVDREGIRVDVSDTATVAGQSAFENNLTYVRVESRVDGELTLNQAIRSATNMG